MKRVLLINTHLGSGSVHLTSALTSNREVQKFKGYAPFNHPDDLKKFTDQRHKCDNSASIYLHELTHNIHWVRKSVRDMCMFIHLIREPRSTLSETCGDRNPQDVLNEYCFRLKGIYEMAARTPGSLIFDISSVNTKAIEEMLDVNIDYTPPTGKDDFPEEFCKKAEEAYERYFKLLGL
jgi:hypothetical protein